MPGMRLREVLRPPDSDHFTYEEALEAWRKVEADQRARTPMKHPLYPPLQPAHHSDRITVEQAMRAFRAVERDEFARAGMTRRYDLRRTQCPARNRSERKR